MEGRANSMPKIVTWVNGSSIPCDAFPASRQHHRASTVTQQATQSKPRGKMPRTPHVGVLGAGLAGLRCTDVLLQRGVKVTILEARDRIGGRVSQSDVGGITVDLGPNWIHGTENNPIVDISNESGTITHSWSDGQAIVDEDGYLMDRETTEKSVDFMWTTVENAFEHSRRNADSLSTKESLYDYFCSEVEKTGMSEPQKAACLELSKLWGAYIGAPVDRQSLKFFFLEECLEGINLFVASTYKKILEHVAKPALEGAKLHLSEPVKAIDAPPRKPDVKHSVKVTTECGNEYTFDEVVTTFPLGWLKQNKSAFTPSLPARLSDAIDSISYGKLEKIYVHFPSAFWHSPKDTNAFGDKSNQEERPPFTQFMTPKYTSHPPTPFWNQECVALSSLPEPCNHPTLLFYLYPPCSTHLIEALHRHPPQSETYNTILTTFLEPFYSRLPNYSPTSPDCVPHSFVATAWQTDPYAGNGSYSNFQVGLEHGDRDIEVMREGVGRERGLWFAGEHTAPFVAVGTTVGAYWSGEEVAGRVCDVAMNGAQK